MIEAECTRCKEIFIPASIEFDDLIHGQTEMEEPCGGIGIILGEWQREGHPAVTESPNATQWYNRRLMQFEAHGKAEPHCTDEHCVWHHPGEF